MAYTTNKTLNVRIKNKYDSYENWAASKVILEAGEIAIAYTSVDVAVDNGTAKHPALLMKVGDGSSTFASLPWLSAKAADVLEACKDETALTTFVNSVIADAGIASDEAMEALAGRVTTAEGKITTLEGEMDAAEGRITTAEAAIDALELLVGDDSVESQIAAAINALNLGTTYAKASDLVTTQNEFAAYQTSNNAAVSANTQAIAGIKDHATIDSFGDVVNELAQYAKDADFQGVAGRVTTAEGKITTLEGKMETAEGKIQTAEGKITTLEGEMDVAEGKIETLEGKMETAEGKIQTAEGKITALEGLVGDSKVEDQIAGAIAVEEERAKAAEKANADAIATLKGNASVDGSVDKKIADAINEFATQVTDDNTYNTYAELINYVASHGSDFTKLVGEVSGNTNAIATLNSNAETAGSVDKKIADAIDAENLAQYAKDADFQGVATRLGTAEGEIDTLQTEMDAVEAKAVANETAIGALGALVGDTKVETQISNAIEALNLNTTYAKASDLATTQGDLDALEVTVGNLADIAATGNVDDLIQTVNTYIVFDCGSASTVVPEIKAE